MGKRVVCAGTFDYLHQGHVDFLSQAKGLGDELVVIVARDATVLKIKGFKPTHNEALRAQRVRETGIPDLVVLGNLEHDLFHILDELDPDVIALGYDQRVSEEVVLRRCRKCRVVRLGSYYPEKFKSSLYRNREEKS
ncbi:MAG TPA: adenylyltransferase/cytidyltransferase family protein [Dissulfurispiraceae bacterium]|nr:adenylyltransferase/cytidyltransferase family protein [Dissulfurispiraceae bacterium]